MVETGTKPSDLPKRRGRSTRAALARRLLPRIVIAYGLLTGAYFVLESRVGGLFAHGASSWIVATSWIPYLAEITWIETGFFAHDILLPIGRTIETPTLAFAFFLPLGLALALPAEGRIAWWLRLAITLTVGYLLCSLLLAIVIEEALVAALQQFGIVVHEPPRPALVRTAADHVWDISEVVYPIVMCAWISHSSLRVISHDSSDPTEPWLKRSRWLTASALVAAWIALLALEVTAERKLAMRASDSGVVAIRKLEALNPDFGSSLLMLGELYLRHRQHGPAYQMFERARSYPDKAFLAKDGMRRARRQARPKIARMRRQQGQIRGEGDAPNRRPQAAPPP
jgi:hypothetical protein